MAESTIRISMNTRLVQFYIHLIAAFAPIVGVERTLRFAELAPRLVLIKVNDGRWRFFRPDMDSGL
jgi:hypothetical protein